jgi:hypothetical protein
MPKAKPAPSIGQSLLVRTLTEWGAGAKRGPATVFSTRIADLIDISSAIELSDFFKLLKNQKADGAAPRSDISLQYEQHVAAMRDVIDTSFDPRIDGDAVSGRPQATGKSFSLPEVTAESLHDPEAFQPYARFYSLQQSELERRTSIIRSLLMSELRARSDELARVAALDSALEPLLLNFGRRCFAVIPDLLENRFEHWRERQRHRDVEAEADSTLADWMSAGGWITQFRRDMRRLLLAEMVLRTEPLRGLLKTLGHELSVEEYS